MNYCKKCGNKLEQGVKYCSHCGFQIQEISNTKQKKKFSFFKCILICIGISFGLNFVTSLISILFRLNNSPIDLYFIQVSLPILIIVFGPIILYSVKNR